MCARRSGVCSLHLRVSNTLDFLHEGRKRGEGNDEKRMSHEMSLVWLLLSSSVQRSLLPWESAVWRKLRTEGAKGAAADKAHPTTLIRRRRRNKSGEKESESAKQNPENRFANQSHPHNMPAGREEEEGKRKVSESSSGVGKQIAEEVRRRRICEKEHYKRERLHCAELITPTPTFANQKEEELNSWRGGEEIKRKKQKRKLSLVFITVLPAFMLSLRLLKIT